MHRSSGGVTWAAPLWPVWCSDWLAKTGGPGFKSLHWVTWGQSHSLLSSPSNCKENTTHHGPVPPHRSEPQGGPVWARRKGCGAGVPGLQGLRWLLLRGPSWMTVCLSPPQVDQSGLGLPSRDNYLNKTQNEKAGAVLLGWGRAGWGFMCQWCRLESRG